MKNLIWLARGVGLTAPVAAHATPVTWSFYETGITSCNIPANCVLPPQPYIFMTLVLPGPTSAGTAIWDGVNPPAYTGDSFVLNVPFTRSLTPAFMGNPGPFGPGCSDAFARSAICDFNISWSETAGDLTSVSITIDAVNDVRWSRGPPDIATRSLCQKPVIVHCVFPQPPSVRSEAIGPPVRPKTCQSRCRRYCC
jgi:hypothetical protein